VKKTSFNYLPYRALIESTEAEQIPWMNIMKKRKKIVMEKFHSDPGKVLNGWVNELGTDRRSWHHLPGGLRF
jgi:hypothetical protein